MILWLNPYKRRLPSDVFYRFTAYVLDIFCTL